jgi:hypothetical protein
MLHELSYLGEKLNEFNAYIKRINPSVTAVSHIMWAEMQHVQPPWDRWILINLKHQVPRNMGGYKIGFTSQSSKPHHIDQKLAKSQKQSQSCYVTLFAGPL